MKRLTNYWNGSWLLSIILFVGILAGCSDETTGGNSDNGAGENSSGAEEPFEIEIFATTFSTNPPGNDSPVVQALEEYTNTKLTFNWAPNSNIDDKFNITLASGDLPHILYVPSKTPSFISAARDGAFWELEPYLADYENLSQANEMILDNTRIDGKIYGIYRQRSLGRNGIVYRQDWLDNLGMDVPETIDDFYEMLWAFTYEDPNGTGVDDTYGTVISKYEGPWNIMQTWFGVPNKWGEIDGELVPDFKTAEYREALKFFKKIYDEGLVNEDFAVMDTTEWTKPLENGEVGVFVDVLDAGERARAKIEEQYPDNPDPIRLLGSVEGPYGHRALPTSGYSGMLAIPKSKVKTEEELRRVLTFLDQLNDEEVQILAGNGIEGRHYEIVDGEYHSFTADNEGLLAEYESLNQIMMFIPVDKVLAATPNELKQLEAQILEDNIEIVVPNPAEALISEVYSKQGQQLDTIISDARIQYIVGQIDETGLDEAIELWEKSGGNELVAEMNELYKEAQANRN
ncbi:putative aldouronate transport system substrate-binding protein [Evansella caseinilytica]|uniref:Putative aldouronate transport system substrate-binding protein n=1 Tax=Evansella caseinilytica TaxID=1503961 RepID=A0A1H3GL27_9BACI|nr:extracellular solute-binding protein [Evansella caseinilytica]SDY03338.1 putative aldouronate transport system substrate-binding protein [Evansella caseinilytica]